MEQHRLSGRYGDGLSKPPQWYSSSDIRALVETWGLEDDQNGAYEFKRSSTGQLFQIANPLGAAIASYSDANQLIDFKPCQRIHYSTVNSDVLTGQDQSSHGWGNDWLAGGQGDDLISGGGGRDQLVGGEGDDILRGGSGQDVLEGGNGSDQLYGGGGRNTLIPGMGADGLYIFSDQLSSSVDASQIRKGLLADVVLGLSSEDRIVIIGCRTDQLKCVDLADGLAIYALDTLEAVIFDSELTLGQLSGIVSGDATRNF